MNAVDLISGQLVSKYNLPIPRYTSYPTVPFWQPQIEMQQWQQNVQQQFARHNKNKGISLYLHLPFCESLCTYCGCNKKITTNHKVEETYLDAISKEWHLYLQTFHEKPVIAELHLGGGTPTFFSPANLDRLLHNLFNYADKHVAHEFSIEGHPNNTTPEHLQVLHKHGFRRISFGVQDNDPLVQRVINRIQPLKKVMEATDMARSAGFTSINFDLIYGLPLQNLQSIERTFNEVLQLRPDRIAFYSYAHVPWTSKAQRLFDEHDLPSPAEKLRLYQKGKEMLLQQGYVDIGMDHFSLPNDTLYQAFNNGTLHRNFMGYTTQHTNMLIGLGVSAISDSGNAFAQNEKNLGDYYQRIERNEIPVHKGYFLNKEDLEFKKYILDICCKQQAVFSKENLPLLRRYSFPQLQKMADDDLLYFNDNGVQLTETGRYFIRNAAAAFDLKMQQKHADDRQFTFSKSI